MPLVFLDERRDIHRSDDNAAAVPVWTRATCRDGSTHTRAADATRISITRGAQMDQTALVDTIVKTPEYMSAVIAAVGAIVGAVLATIVTLLSVSMQNRHSRNQQRLQLEADSLERQRERRISLRRDVYLPVADSVVGMVGALGKLLGGDPSSAQGIIAGAQAFGAALTRIQMVGTPETVKHVAEYQRAFISTTALLQRLNHPLMLRKADIDIAQNTRQRYDDERTKCIELLKEYNLAGGGDPQRFRRIEQQAAYASERCAEAHSEWLRLMLAQEAARLELFREFGKQMNELAKLQAPVLAAIRSELEASDDSSALIEEETQKTAVVGMQTLTDTIPLVESSIERLRADVEADEQQRRNPPAAER